MMDKSPCVDHTPSSIETPALSILPNSVSFHAVYHSQSHNLYTAPRRTADCYFSALVAVKQVKSTKVNQFPCTRSPTWYSHVCMCGSFVEILERALKH